MKLANHATEATPIGLRHDHVRNDEIDAWVSLFKQAESLAGIRASPRRTQHL
ncbi:MAG TPA: hypothetical protein VL287_13365 [Gemmatimonadales bacterium]|jgi:hypothetical protein|nr:hypothetical protein [Gemmatimonadales bacterium]